MVYLNWYHSRTAEHINNKQPIHQIIKPKAPETTQIIASYDIHSGDIKRPLDSNVGDVAEKGLQRTAQPGRQPTSFKAVSAILVTILLIASCQMSILLLFALK